LRSRAASSPNPSLACVHDGASAAALRGNGRENPQAKDTDAYSPLQPTSPDNRNRNAFARGVCMTGVSKELFCQVCLLFIFSNQQLRMRI
jgi:hypothetical protein